MTKKTQGYIVTTIRFHLVALFLLSGIGKLIDGSDALYMVELLATEFYWLIEYGNLIVLVTSVVELALAGLLLWGTSLKPTLLASAALLLFFSSILFYFYLQGQSIANCGCFGAFGFGGGLEPTLIRNVLLLALVGTGFVFSRASPVTADSTFETTDSTEESDTLR